MTGGVGNGAAYYDNYVYFSKNTTIARYGPLNGTKGFNGDYWAGTLSLTQLTNLTGTYPRETNNTVEFPTHILHRHSDGRLYIADVVDNQGTLHYIKTTKTTVEGDTNDGSTYNILQFGYGLKPIAMESYGDQLVIALWEGPRGNTQGQRAKLVFWDTVSTRINQILWVEFPDSLISALKNINGTLYIISGRDLQTGFRVSRYIGGYSVEEVAYMDRRNVSLPLPCGVDGNANRLIFAASTDFSNDDPNIQVASIYSLGLQKHISDGVFNVMSCTQSVYSIGYSTRLLPGTIGADTMVLGWSDGSVHGMDTQTGNYTANRSLAPQFWLSQYYRIGQPFKVTKLRIPVDRAISTNHSFTIKVIVDDSTTYTLTSASSTNDNGKFNVVRRSDSSGNPILGQNNFYLQLGWTGSSLIGVTFPITIEYELIDD